MWFDPNDSTAPVITAQQQIISDHRGEPLSLPDTALIFFMSRGMEVALTHPSHLVTERFPRFLNACPLGQFDTGNQACFLPGGSGAPQAADTVETLAACGVRRIIALGMCGVFRDDLHVGDVIIPPWALIEEGTSLHYADNPRRSEATHTLVERAAAAFPDAKILPIVSTDAVYRQTFHKEQLWREQGCAGVDMETSALFTLGRVLGIETVSILIASDKHPEHPDAPAWAWSLTRNQREAFLQRGITFIHTL